MKSFLHQVKSPLPAGPRQTGSGPGPLPSNRAVIQDGTAAQKGPLQGPHQPTGEDILACQVEVADGALGPDGSYSMRMQVALMSFSISCFLYKTLSFVFDF